MTPPARRPSGPYPHHTVLEAAQASLRASLQRIDTICDTLEEARAFCREALPGPNVDTQLLPLWMYALEEDLIEVDTLAMSLDSALKHLEKNHSPVVALDVFHPPVRDAITDVLVRDPAWSAPGTSGSADAAYARRTRAHSRNHTRGPRGQI